MSQHPPESAPSHQFLNCAASSESLSDRGTAFLGSNSGFLPPKPLPLLPPPFTQWAVAATGLPAVCRSGDWQSFVANFPEISAEALADDHLLRANAYLGAVAHALHNIACLPVPDKVMKPWVAIGERLERPCASFNTLDWFIYNFEFVQGRFVHKVSRGELPSNPAKDATLINVWQQTKPYITVTGCMTETHFITGCFAIEHAARNLPGVIAKAQQAVVLSNETMLRDALVEVIHIIEDMTVGFQSADLRPLSRTFVDPVEWGRCIGDVGLPVVKGEKTISGLLFPSVHLLDVFFSRRSYETEMGVLEKTDREWLPPLHRRFLDAVSQVSVLEFIEKHTKSKELQCILARAVSSFASESGFLGRHRLRIIGILELSMKVGRSATAAGTETMSWQNRIWRRINNAMSDGMQERLKGFSRLVHTAIVERCEQLDEKCGSAHRVILDTNGALIYSPGDHIAIWPENDELLVKETLNALQLDASTTIATRRRSWVEALRDRGLEIGSDGAVHISAAQFLRVASLQPFDHDLGQRLVSSMYVVNPAVKSYLYQEKATNLPIAIRMLSETGIISGNHLSSSLDTLLEPLSPRYYSISSHMFFSPSSVEICVGSVQYKPQSSLSFKYGLIPWRRREDSEGFSPSKNGEELLNRYIKSVPKGVEGMDGPRLSPESIELSYRANKNFMLYKSLMQKISTILSRSDHEASGSLPNVTMKARSRAEVICYEAKRSRQEEPELRGVSSSFLSALTPGSKVRVQVIPEIDFHIPKDPEVPITMISLGTGVAPFRSFMKELIRQKPNDGTPCRPAWLILGVQTKSKIPFLQDIEEAVCKHKVMELSVAFSREDIDLDMSRSANHLSFRRGARKRIQGLFEQDSTIAGKLWHMINTGGHIYACGQPDLEPLVRELVSFTVKRFAHALCSSTYFDTNRDLPTLADKFADKLAAERRLHIDVYHSGRPAVSKSFFSPATVAQHRTEDSCWVLFRGNVYDITKYLPVHPGGPKILWDKAGRDMTEDFDEAHGSQNIRIASMIEPYKIGEVQPFHKSSERMKTFMTMWSVPLMYGVMEHRSVFLLDVNEFPTMNEPQSFIEWRSQASGQGAKRSLYMKFWNIYEPRVFGFILDFLRPEKLGNALKSLSGYLKGDLDCAAILDEVREQKQSMMRRVANGEERLLSQSLKQFCVFMDELVEVCVDIQTVVEKALYCPLSVHAFEDVSCTMLASIIQTMKQGIRTAYSSLPHQVQDVEEN